MTNDNILDYLYSVRCENCPLGECCKIRKQVYKDFITPCAKLIATFTVDDI